MTKEEFKNLASQKCKEIGMQYTQNAVNMVFDIFEKAFHTGFELGVSQCQQMVQMIPVEERLPLEDLRVLCRMKSNGQIVSGYLFKQNGKVCVATDSNFHFEDYEDYEATHWFPMFDAKGIDPDDVCPCRM